jgi:TPR repeat protein
MITKHPFIRFPKKIKMIKLRFFSVALSLFIFLLLNVQSSVAEISFLAMGDSPYNSKEFYLIKKELKNLPKNAKFIIHLGDMKQKKRDCIEKDYKDFSELLKRSPIPVFIIPGDNGYSVCNDYSMAKQFWDRYISEFEKNWKVKFSVNRQKEQKENFAFFLENTLFVGINLFEKRDRDNIKFNKILQNNIFWIKENIKNYHEKTKTLVIFAHDFSGLKDKNLTYEVCGDFQINYWEADQHYKYFSDRLVFLAQEFKRPILYMQGNHHCWVNDQPYKEAKNLTRIAVDKIEHSPMVKMAIEDNNFVIDQRINKRIDFFIDEANLGDVWSQYYLGLEYLKLKDYENAKKWLIKASDQNFPPAQVRLCQLFQEGVNKDGGQSFNKALELCNSSIQSQYFDDNYTKKVINNDVHFSYQKRIIQLRRETLKKSKYDGFFHLGAMHFNGQGTSQNNKKALKYFKKASEGNIGMAHYNIGVMYQKGLGVKKDLKEAKNWFFKGALTGLGVSSYNLGIFYLKGLGTKQNYKKAVKWFKHVKNSPQSLYNLGVLYYKGLGVAQDYKMATMYFIDAAKRGNPEARKILNDFRKHSNK